MAVTAHERFARLARLPDEQIDLAEAALLIAAEAEPALDAAACLRELDALAAAAAEHLTPEAGPRARVEALGRFLFEQEGFQGNAADYYDARNSFLHEVLRRRTGIPITLALVFMELGKRLGLPMEGVNFPGHFLVRHTAPDGEVLVDPFSGRVLSALDCEHLLRRTAGPQAQLAPHLMQAATPKGVLRRMLTNLKLIYLHQRAWPEALSCMERILLLAPDDPHELRDRGLLFLRLECHAEAAADLERYLILAGHEPAAETVRPYLDEARAKARHLN
ncbi:MAG TPA: tetratricopeptide repeat protein [bacterium]|nr:tetratricopeptide repeat protein [bacterium]